jgi:hypothetical protein
VSSIDSSDDGGCLSFILWVFIVPFLAVLALSAVVAAFTWL